MSVYKEFSKYFLSHKMKLKIEEPPSDYDMD
jgi:hypothetical protein